MKNIAILVPSYNATSTLEGTLKAILAQGSDLAERIDFVMLSDDGSKDDTVALAERLWVGTPVPMQVKRAAVNQGEYRNVNGAFAAMPPHIEWVLIMHADNHALPGWIRYLARECDRAEAEVGTICGSWEYVVDDRLIDAGDQRGPDFVETVHGDDAAIRRTLLEGCWWHNSTCAMRVSAWKAIGGHPQETALLRPLEMLGWATPPNPPTLKMRIKGDWDAQLRLLSSGRSIRYVGVPMIRYIDLSSSVSAGSFAWHGDVLETMQVMRRHQAVLSATDIVRFHTKYLVMLLRRLGGAILRANWKRAGLALWALPFWLTSVVVTFLNHEKKEGGRLDSIPFNYP
jgi:glycosyltransferase involved in cell wall biosynthesis